MDDKDLDARRCREWAQAAGISNPMDDWYELTERRQERWRNFVRAMNSSGFGIFDVERVAMLEGNIAMLDSVAIDDIAGCDVTS